MNNDHSPTSFQQHLARWHAVARTVDTAALLGGTRHLGVIVPHADDETLGCGGLIALAAARGIAITVTILTDGAASHPGSSAWPPARLAERRQAEAREAVATLAGAQATLDFIGAPDGDLNSTSGLDARIAAADLFVTCWHGDPHPDHRAAFAIARAAARRHGVPLLAFPLWVLTTPTPVPSLPVMRLDIGDVLARKRSALAAHASQLGGLIDDAEGFVLTDALQRLFVRADELFVLLAA